MPVLKMSNFGNYRQQLSKFNDSFPKFRILSPGITNSNPGKIYCRNPGIDTAIIVCTILAMYRPDLWNNVFHHFVFEEGRGREVTGEVEECRLLNPLLLLCHVILNLPRKYLHPTQKCLVDNAALCISKGTNHSSLVTCHFQRLSLYCLILSNVKC